MKCFFFLGFFPEKCPNLRSPRGDCVSPAYLPRRGAKLVSIKAVSASTPYTNAHTRIYIINIIVYTGGNGVPGSVVLTA